MNVSFPFPAREFPDRGTDYRSPEEYAPLERAIEAHHRDRLRSQEIEDSPTPLHGQERQRTGGSGRAGDSMMC